MNLITVLLMTLISTAAFAQTQVDGILASNMLRTLISDSAKLWADELEHDKVVGNVPVELVLARAISQGATLSNKCNFVGRSKWIQCVLTMKTKTDSSELIYTGLADHESGAKITKVISKTL